MLLLEDAVKADFRRYNHLHIQNENRECYKWYMIHFEQLHISNLVADLVQPH